MYYSIIIANVYMFYLNLNGLLVSTSKEQDCETSSVLDSRFMVNGYSIPLVMSQTECA